MVRVVSLSLKTVLDSSCGILLRIHIVSELLIRLVPFSAKDSYAYILEGTKVSPSSLDFVLLMCFEFGRDVIKVYFGNLFWQCDIGQMGEKETWRPIKRWM